MNPERVTAIVLGTVKHSDRSNILTVYTADKGRMAFVVSASKGRNANMLRARTLPLSMVEITYRPAPGVELQRASSVAPLHLFADIYFHPMKNAVGIFLAEFMSRLLRDTAPDPLMFQFVRNSLLVFERLDAGVANFHIAFLVNCASFAGIYPDITTYRRGMVFDMQQGCFTSEIPLHQDWLQADQSEQLLTLCRINYLNLRRFRFTREQRNQILDGILHYYAIHLPGMGKLKSPDVLRECF